MNEHPSGEIVLYQRGDAPAINVRLDGDTVWLSQQQLADLFQSSRTNVAEHNGNIYADGELSQDATCREFRQVRTAAHGHTASIVIHLRVDSNKPVAGFASAKNGYLKTISTLEKKAKTESCEK